MKVHKMGDSCLYQSSIVADLGEGPQPPLFWVKKITERRKAGRESQKNVPPCPP